MRLTTFLFSGTALLLMLACLLAASRCSPKPLVEILGISVPATKIDPHAGVMPVPPQDPATGQPLVIAPQAEPALFSVDNELHPACDALDALIQDASKASKAPLPDQDAIDAAFEAKLFGFRRSTHEQKYNEATDALKWMLSQAPQVSTGMLMVLRNDLGLLAANGGSPAPNN